MFKRISAVLLVAAGTLPALAQAQVVTSGSGATPGDILGVVNTFRTSLGTLNPNVAGSFGSGRREINWDAVPDARADPNNLPLNFFNVNSPRGAVFSTPGSAVQVSANATNPTSTPIEFGSIDASYTGVFQTFSAQRLFTPIGSNIVDVTFFVPGSSSAALVRAFGSVFSDVDLANTTSIQFFDASNTSLGTFFAPTSPVGIASEGLSFLGVDFSTPVISRVRITNGNAALGSGVPDNNGNLNDLVVMDDFIYGEPIAAVPEPGSLALCIGLAGMGAGFLWRRRRCKQA